MSRIVRTTWLCLAVAIFVGCARAPTLARSGGYVVTYNAQPGQKYDGATMVSALQARLREFGYRHAAVSKTGDDEFTIELPGASEEDVSKVEKVVGSLGQLELQVAAETGVHDVEIAAALAADEGGNKAAGEGYRWVREPTDKDSLSPTMVVRDAPSGSKEVLVLTSENDVTGADFTDATVGRDSSLHPCILGTLGADGSHRMQQLSSENIDRKLAIVFDDALLSAPVVRSPISDRLQITGKFTQEEVDLIVALLRAGALPARLISKPAAVEKIYPQ